MPWICLMAVSSNVLIAANGVEAYRQGNYLQAMRDLSPAPLEPEANYYLGIMRLYGYGELRNNVLALRYFTQAAEKGYAPAQQLLGAYYLHKNQPEKAFNWFKMAAKSDLSAQLYCAAAYTYGFGVRKNIDSARVFYIEGAKKGNAIAQRALGEYFLQSRNSRDKKMGLIWLSKAADQGNAQALVQLGKLMYQGGISTKDLAKANLFLEKAIAQNYLPAFIVKGEWALAQKDFDQAKEWFEKAAKQGNNEAQLALAKWYLDKNNPAYHTESAVSWASKAANQGQYEGQLLLANLYKNGLDAGNDEHLAQAWQKKAEQTAANASSLKNLRIKVSQWLSNGASSDFSLTPYQVGGIYNAWENKHALKENIYNAPPHMPSLTKEAIFKPQFIFQSPAEIPINQYFDLLMQTAHIAQSSTWNFPRYPLNRQIAALQRDDSLVLKHDPDSLLILEDTSHPYEKLILPFDYFEESIAGWQRQVNYQNVLLDLYNRAILGEPDAQFEIGQLYQYGIGVAKSSEQALIYLELAAAQQDVRAEYNLGLLYLQAQTIPVDYQKGLDWMKDAAFKGNSFAEYVLANIYKTGLTDSAGHQILPADQKEALAMLYLASANHFGEAEYQLATSLVQEKTKNLSVTTQNKRNQLIKRLYGEAVAQGLIQAQLPLAFYNAMDPHAEKQAQAYQFAKEAAQKGDSNAAVLMGLMLERGISVASDPVEALYWYEQAAQNPISKFILGTYYSEGRGVAQDVQKGQLLLEEAADAGFTYALFNLAILQEKMGQPFLIALDKACQQGNSKAGMLLADYYLLASQETNNIAQAQAIYAYFAEKGDKDAQLKMGFLAANGLDGKENQEAAFQWYVKAANQDQPVAQYLLAQLYQLGTAAVAPDYQQAKKWYTHSQAHYVPAATALGFLYDTVENNYTVAQKNYHYAAEAHDAVAEYNLGLIYEYGKGVAVDNQKAKAWYEKSAIQEYPPAMTQLASLYLQGVLGQGDEQQALHWYKKATKSGDPMAAYYMGLLSETGVAAPLDFTAALAYYKQAAAQGNEKAKAALARMYQYGIGVEEDKAQALILYKELAKNNNAYAQYHLGLMYMHQAERPEQLQTAQALLINASKNGSKQAERWVQWLGAQQALQNSFIEPVDIESSRIAVGDVAPDRMYLEALSEWNKGEEKHSKQILQSLIIKYPNFKPAKYAYEHITNPLKVDIQTKEKTN